MRCPFVCVRATAFAAAFTCFGVSTAIFIYLAWRLTAEKCLKDPEGIYYFQFIRRLGQLLIILLVLEAVASLLVLIGIIKKKELWMQPFVWYHGGITLVIAITLPSIERTHSVILFSLLGAVISASFWLPIFFHQKQLVSRRLHFQEQVHTEGIGIGELI